MSSISYTDARDILLSVVSPVGTEQIPLKNCAGRILGFDLTAKENVPPFDRSPYDGYAFISEDTKNASKESPVTLKILEEIPAGGVSHMPVTHGCAVKILTGAPIPEGADAVTMFEKTEFTDTEVKIFEYSSPGTNIVCAGEDIKAGAVIAEKGTVIDFGLSASLAGQNIAMPEVYRVPKAGIISTGSELLDVGEALKPGRIYNSNRYSLTAALKKLGCEPIFIGTADDDSDVICALLEKALETCDIIFMTGGVSVGDYDLTPEAMEKAGVNILFSDADLKPGMACCYGTMDGKAVCALSGNPFSSMSNFYAIAQPAVKKLAGMADYLPEEIEVTLGNDFKKKSKGTRVIKAKLDLTEGTAKAYFPEGQGNVMIGSSIGCDLLVIIPAGSGPLQAGTRLKAIQI